MSTPESPIDTTQPGRPRRGTTRPTARVPRQRQWGWVVLAVFALAGAGGGNAWLVAQLDERTPMMTLSHDIPWGQPVTDSDVTTVDLSPEARSVGIPQDQWDHTVRGRVAAVPLRAGQLLSRSALTTQTVPGPGQQVVGLRLSAGHAPARGLVPNDPIQVLPLNPAASADPTTDAVAGPGFPARVVRANPPDPDGAVTADVLVTQDQASAASSAAASGALVTLLGPTH